MAKTKKNPDFDLMRMRKKYSDLFHRENPENAKKVDDLFMKIFLADFNLFADVLIDARNS